MPTALDTVDAPPVTSSPTTTGRQRRTLGYRPDIQGLRAVAVLIVVIYHVFLLISAFFLTLSFTGKLENARPLALGRYWLHVFKRLLPLAVLTIVGTMALVGLFFPPTGAGQWRTEALASVFYVENWALAA